jgi:hypothetical protein
MGSRCDWFDLLTFSKASRLSLLRRRPVRSEPPWPFRSRVSMTRVLQAVSRAGFGHASF